jgi:hypothetical protein
MPIACSILTPAAGETRPRHRPGAAHLKGGGTHERAEHSRGGDAAVHDVVDLVRLQTEDLAEAAADLIQQDHGACRGSAVKVLCAPCEAPSEQARRVRVTFISHAAITTG